MLHTRPKRSIIIPVLDFSPHSPFNISTLLQDLENVEGEVICIFNSDETFHKLHTHPRITRYAFNSQNAGVSRSWNIGLNLSEGKTAFILNADLKVHPVLFDSLESYLYSFEKAVLVGPQGSLIDWQTLKAKKYFQQFLFNEPVQTDEVSGFLFGLNLSLFQKHRLQFDARFSPCFFEEMDMGLQIKEAGLRCYAVPVVAFEHRWGVSQFEKDRVLNYFGREVSLSDILDENKAKFIEKWGVRLAQI